MIYVPILLIGFNRPDIIKQSWAIIKSAKPRILYVSIDGPRDDKEKDNNLILKVKEIVKDVDWDCRTYYTFHDKNVGAELNISNAISWVLEKEEYVIVLEDDIITSNSFFYFAQEMLEKYKYEKKVFMVSSNQWTPINMENNADYLFGIYGHTNGWATWKRAWDKFDINNNTFQKVLNSKKIHNVVFSKIERIYWTNIIKYMNKKGAGNNSWDYCWLYTRLVNNGLSIIPRVNLSSNIGVYGLHTSKQTNQHYLHYENNFVAAKHPQEVIRNIKYDEYHFKKYIYKNISFVKIVLRKLRNILFVTKS